MYRVFENSVAGHVFPAAKNQKTIGLFLSKSNDLGTLWVTNQREPTLRPNRVYDAQTVESHTKSAFQPTSVRFSLSYWSIDRAFDALRRMRPPFSSPRDQGRILWGAEAAGAHLSPYVVFFIFSFLSFVTILSRIIYGGKEIV